MTAEVRAFHVQPGTLIELHDIELEPDQRDQLVGLLAAACGHDDFVLLHTWGDGHVNVLTPESAMLLIQEATTQEGTTDGYEE